MSSEHTLARVRKLLAKAEDPACTEAEAAAFTAKATELIAKYGVDRALLAAGDPGIDPIGDRILRMEPPYALDKAGLLSRVAVPLRCSVVRRRRNGLEVHLFGHASDLERVEILFTSLLVQAAHGLAAAPAPKGYALASFRRSWLAGFAGAVHARLRAAEESAVAESGGPSTALVLVDRSARVERRVSEIYPDLTTAAPRRLRGGGQHLGYAAGQRADLGGPRIGG